MLRITKHSHNFSTRSTFEQPEKFTKKRAPVNQPTLVAADRYSIHFLLPQRLMANRHALASDRGIGTFEPDQRLAYGDSSRYGSLTNPKPQLDSYLVSCPFRRKQAEPNLGYGKSRNDRQDSERYRVHAP